MKLIYCPRCKDIFRLYRAWRRCRCGASGGGYQEDNVTATIGGEAEVFGIANPFFDSRYKLVICMEDKKLAEYRQENGYGDQRSECWWGEFEGDTQIERISEAGGPDSISLKQSSSGKNRLWWAFQALLGKVDYWAVVKNLRLLQDELTETYKHWQGLSKYVRDNFDVDEFGTPVRPKQ